LPLHRSFAVDAWLRPATKSATAPMWSLAAVRLQLGLVYFFAGIAKINPDWLFDALPLRIWLRAHTDFPLLGPFFDQPGAAYAMSWAGMLYDLAIPFLLLFPLTRWPAYAAVVVFHVLTRALFPIGMFPWLMIGCTLVFFSAEDFARLARWLGWQAAAPATAPQPPSQLRPALAVLLGIFFAVQILVPLRHWLYPGNVLWTEEGYRFSWRVMLVEKTGHVTYYVEDVRRGVTFPIYPSDYLTYQQEKQMSFQPDMILEFAHYLETRLREAGLPDVAIRAQAYVSWNGRPSQLLIDPTVDLTAHANNLAPKTWVIEPGAARQ
jgi:hypothetical protein